MRVYGDSTLRAGAIQSNNFSYVSITTLRNVFPRVQGQATEKPEKPEATPKPRKTSTGA